MYKFGVGCFAFGFKSPVKTTLQEYKDRLKKALERISNVSSVDIELSDDYPIDFAEEVESMGESGIVPMFSDIRIRFSLHIPYRVQKELHKDELNCGTENFLVFIDYDWHGPFAIIVSVDSNEECIPSQSVICVREFLEKNFSDELLRFEFLGPSPFHANFYVLSDKGNQREKIIVKNEEKKGYDKIEFIYPESMGLVDAVNEILYELSAELSLYYYIQAAHVNTLKSWEELQSKVNAYLSKSPVGFIRESINSLRDRHSIDELVTDLGKFKIFEIQHSALIQEYLHGIYDSSAFEGYIKSYNENHPPIMKYPIDEVIETIKFVSGRRSKSYEIVIGVLSGICGGVIGSLLTIITHALSGVG